VRDGRCQESSQIAPPSLLCKLWGHAGLRERAVDGPWVLGAVQIGGSATTSEISTSMTAAEDQRRYRTRLLLHSPDCEIDEKHRNRGRSGPFRMPAKILRAGANVSAQGTSSEYRPGRHSAVAAASNISMPEAIDEILRGRPSPAKETCGPYPGSKSWPISTLDESRGIRRRRGCNSLASHPAWRRLQIDVRDAILHEPHAKLAALPPYGVAEAARFAVLGQEQGEDVRQCVRAGSRNPCSLIRRVPHNAGNPAAAFQHDPCRLASGRAFLLAEITPQSRANLRSMTEAGMRHARGCRGSGRSRIVGVVAPSPPLGCVT